VLDAYGRSGLWLAASNGYVECVRSLLRNGCRGLLDLPANAGCSETRGRTPLLIAAMRGHTEARGASPREVVFS
jgi:ankyrin repeat protein